MKFLFAKKIKICKHCETSIDRGELYILNSHRNKVTGRYFSFPYHYECYIKHFTERVRRDALHFMKQLEPPKKLGRPRKHSNPKLINRKKSLVRYHREAGHTERAIEIQQQIDLLTTDT